MNKKIKKIVLFFVTLSSCLLNVMYASQSSSSAPVNTAALNGSPTMQNALTANNYNPIAAAQAVQQNNIAQANYFFSQLPQANTLPVAIKNEITRVYIEGLGLPSAIVAQIEQLYSLLYLIAEEEALVNQFAPSGTLPTSGQVTVPSNFSLTGQQLIQSKVWQDYLKIKIAYSYDQELNFLGQIHQNELQGFQFLPQFELNFYQDSFVQLRTSSQLTRFYLLMTERLRERYLSQCADWQSIVTATDPATLLTQRTTLFNDIETFKKSDFYTTTMQFESVDPESTFPLSATSQSYATSTNFPSMFSVVNGKLTVNGEYASFFEIDPTSGNVMMTGLGSLVYKGNIVASTTTKSGYAFETTSLFQKLFVPPQAQSNGTTAMSPTLGYMELLCFSAIKALNAELAYLFSSANLANTLQKINALGQINIPFFIFYQQQDYMFLDEINQLVATLNNNTLAPGGLIAQSFWSSIGHFFKHTIYGIGDDIKNDGESIYSHVVQPFGNAIEHAGIAIADSAEAAGLYIGYGCTGDKSLLQSAEKAQSAAIQNIQDGLSDLSQTISGITASIKTMAGQLAYGAAYATGGFLYFFDKNALNDWVGLATSLTDIFVDASIDYTLWSVQLAGDEMMLTADAIETMAMTVGDVLSGNVGAIGNAWQQLGENIATAVLSSVTLAASDVSGGLADAMQAIAYIINCVIDAIEDLAGGFAALAVAAIDNSWSAGGSAFSSTKSAIDAHRALISTILTTVVIIGVTVATGGAGSALGAAMLAMNVAQMGMNIVGTAQQDQLTVNQSAEEVVAVNQTAACNVANEINLKNSILAEVAQEEANYACGVDAQNRTLGFYQNWMNDTINCTLSSQAYQIGQLYNFRTLPVIDQNNLPLTPMRGDPGYVYGIQTGRLVLNPGSGFLVYNEGRKTFAQEIATPSASPYLKTPIQGTAADQPTQADSAWFAVKDLSNIPSGQPLQADIIFRSLYEAVQPFYIGIYLTERSLSINEMNTLNTNLNNILNVSGAVNAQAFDQAWSQLDMFNKQLLDYDNLAKIFVCYRDSIVGTPDKTTQLGVYVHNSKQSSTGWLQSPTFKPINFMYGQWYRMQAVLDGKNLRVSFWEVEDLTNVSPLSTPPSNAQTRNFTHIDNAIPFTSVLNPSEPLAFAGSMGVIACGAAVEYQVLSPTSTTFNVCNLRSSSDGAVGNYFSPNNPIEALNEYSWQKTFKNSLSLVMPSNQPINSSGVFNLTAYSESLMLTGQNVYTIVGTLSQTGTLISGMIDYVVLASGVQTNTPTIGVTSASSPSGFVSLVTGIKYWESGTQMSIVGTMNNVLATYQQQISVDPKLLSLIKTAQIKYNNDTINKQFTFNGNINLQADKSCLQGGLYVYKGPALSSTTGTFDSGQTDYYMFSLNSTALSKIIVNQILSPDSTLINFDGAISLSTGQIFNLSKSENGLPTACTSLENISSFYIVPSNKYYDIYTSYKNKLPQSIQTFIDNAKAVQNDLVAINGAQGTVSSAGTVIFNANIALNSIPTTTFSSTDITNDQLAVTTAKNALNNSINNANGVTGISINNLIGQVNAALATLNTENTATPSTPASTIAVATTNLTALTKQLSLASSTISSNTSDLNGAISALNKAITAANASSQNNAKPACPTWADSAGSVFVDPVNWCSSTPYDNCCWAGSGCEGITNSSDTCGITANETCAGYSAVSDVAGCIQVACPNCNHNSSLNPNGISYQCCVYGGPANCADTYPNCTPSQANDDCRLPGK